MNLKRLRAEYEEADREVDAATKKKQNAWQRYLKESHKEIRNLVAPYLKGTGLVIVETIICRPDKYSLSWDPPNIRVSSIRYGHGYYTPDGKFCRTDSLAIPQTIDFARVRRALLFTNWPLDTIVLHKSIMFLLAKWRSAESALSKLPRDMIVMICKKAWFEK